MFDPEEHDVLVRFASSIVGPEWAEDIVQEYYVKQLSGQIAAHCERATRLTWVLQIVKYTAFRWLERESRHRRDLAINGHPTLPEYDALLDAHEQTRTLCPHHQQVLAYVEIDPSYDSIGKALGLSEPQVRGRLYRARQRLKERLA